VHVIDLAELGELLEDVLIELLEMVLQKLHGTTIQAA